MQRRAMPRRSAARWRPPRPPPTEAAAAIRGRLPELEAAKRAAAAARDFKVSFSRAVGMSSGLHADGLHALEA